MHYERRGRRPFLNPDSSIPIYKQIAQWIESEILNGHLEEDQKVFSQYQLAEMFTINPATAAKGINLLVDEQILYKKRGLGMFVTSGAKEAIQYKRKNETLYVSYNRAYFRGQPLEYNEKGINRVNG